MCSLVPRIANFRDILTASTLGVFALASAGCGEPESGPTASTFEVMPGDGTGAPSATGAPGTATSGEGTAGAATDGTGNDGAGTPASGTSAVGSGGISTPIAGPSSTVSQPPAQSGDPMTRPPSVANPPPMVEPEVSPEPPAQGMTPPVSTGDEMLDPPPPGTTPPEESDVPAGEPESQPTDSGASPMPSPGCSGGNPDAMIPNSVLDKPNGYDGSTPSPLLFAFHGAGGNSSSLQGPFAADAKSRGYLGVYLKSSGSAWDPRVDTAVLDEAYEAVTQNYCVDLNRVFAVGHSSGAQMITQLLCAGETRFRAVAPVASSKYCNGWDAVAAIVIHGVDDIERGGQGEMRYGLNDGDGHIDFGVYHDSNECSDASTPFDPSGGNCGANIHPGCVEYDDCAAPTVFCNHDDPQYGTSNHGVPCFASAVMFDFFDARQ